MQGVAVPGANVLLADARSRSYTSHCSRCITDTLNGEIYVVKSNKGPTIMGCEN